MHEIVCSNCGTLGKPRKRVKGSFAMELVLWFFFLVPGMIYSVWRLTTKELVCRTCGSNALVPVFSPVGQQLLAEFSGPSPGAWAEPTGLMRPPAPPTQSSAREVIYDTRSWTENQFALLTIELRKSGIGWNIEADDLVVDKRHESDVDSLIATIVG